MLILGAEEIIEAGMMTIPRNQDVHPLGVPLVPLREV